MAREETGSGPDDDPRLMLLGGFGLRVATNWIPLAPHTQRLLALLALHGRALGRDHVAGLLWGDSSEEHAHGSLRSTLFRLRASGLRLVETSRDSIELAPHVEVDVRRATLLARALVTGCFDPDATVLLDPGYSGELLPGWYDNWVLVERERHRQLCLHALESLCEHLMATCRYGPAILAGLAAVDCEPLRESAHRALIRVHLAEGNVGEAIRRYQHYRGLAARELGVAPSDKMRLLVAGLPAY